jgi:hypothetical protein
VQDLTHTCFSTEGRGKELTSLKTHAKNPRSCHPEIFAFAQDKLREGLKGRTCPERSRKILRFAQNDNIDGNCDLGLLDRSFSTWQKQ